MNRRKRESRISIITVCLNAGELLEKTIQSVVQQNRHDYEYIVVDGGSTDDTGDILAKYEDSIDRIVQQQGKGIYNAMNQGISLASGDYIHFLNAGDEFYSADILTQVHEVMSKEGWPDIIYGDLVMADDASKRVVESPDLLSLEVLRLGMVCHQTIFAKRSLFERNGLFNERYSIVADYEWLVRNIATGEVRCAHLKGPLVTWDTSGISSRKDFRMQQFRAVKKHFGFFKALETVFYPNLKGKLGALGKNT